MITFLQLVFLVTALVILGSAIMVVSSRKLVHSALWLILALFGVAVLFATLEAGFFAVVQVIIYIGAIATLILFTIMLTRKAMEDVGPQVNRSLWLAAITSVVVFVALGWLLVGWQGVNTLAPEMSVDAASVSILGQALVAPNGYMLPFEVASILLLGALVGAIYISRDNK